MFETRPLTIEFCGLLIVFKIQLFDVDDERSSERVHPSNVMNTQITQADDHPYHKQ